MEQDFGIGLKRSLFIHGAILFFVVFKSLVFPSRPANYIPSLRVDIVGLPDSLRKDQQTPADKPASSPEVEAALKKADEVIKKLPPPPKKIVEKAHPNEMVLKPKAATKAKESRSNKMKNALNRIKALERISEETTTENRRAAPLIKGNQISKGASVSGEARESAEANYLDSLRERLQENWELPVWISRQNLSAKAQIQIDSRGRLRGFQMIQSSGNAQFDEAVKRAVSESQPYPFPPAEIAGSLLTGGVLVGFPL